LALAYSFPVFNENGPNPNLAKTLNKKVEEILGIENQTIEEAVDEAIGSFVGLSEEDEIAGDWYQNITISVEVVKNHILSLETNQDEFLGGAHPNAVAIFDNYLISTGERLNIEDLFSGEQFLKVNSAGEEIFRKNYDLVGKDLSYEGFDFEDGNFVLTDNFKVTEKGLYFFYNTYSIAPYSAGTFEVEIPYTKIQTSISKKSPLAILVQ